jgi:hypothetical protein
MPDLEYVNFGMIEDRENLDEKEIEKRLALLEKRARQKKKSR